MTKLDFSRKLDFRQYKIRVRICPSGRRKGRQRLYQWWGKWWDQSSRYCLILIPLDPVRPHESRWRLRLTTLGSRQLYWGVGYSIHFFFLTISELQISGLRRCFYCQNQSVTKDFIYPSYRRSLVLSSTDTVRRQPNPNYETTLVRNLPKGTNSFKMRRTTLSKKGSVPTTDHPWTYLQVKTGFMT